MRVMLYGSQPTINYVKPLLNSLGIDVISVCAESKVENAVNIIRNLDSAQIIFGDFRELQATGIFQNLQWVKPIPIVILFDQNTIDWDEALKINAFGLIPNNEGSRVLARRLEAVIKRFTSIRTGMAITLKTKPWNKAGKIIIWIVVPLLGLLIATLIFFKSMPGYDLYIVRSDGMKPVFQAGSHFNNTLNKKPKIRDDPLKGLIQEVVRDYKVHQ